MCTYPQWREREPEGRVPAGTVASSCPPYEAAPCRPVEEPPVTARVRPGAIAKRVLVISSHFPPERGAGVHRMLRLVRHLSADGWPVTVLTLDPRYYRAGTPVDTGLLARLPSGIQVYRTKALRGLAAAARWRRRLREACGSAARRFVKPAAGRSHEPGPAGASNTAPAKRPFIDGEIGWLWHALRQGTAVVSRHKPEIIFSSAPPFTCHLIAAWLARRHNVRWVADFRDPWARSPWGGSTLTDSCRGRLRRWLERLVIERADAVILNTPLLRDDFAAHYGPRIAQKFHTVTNGYDVEPLTPYLHRAPRPSSRLVLTHTGSLYRRRDPRSLVQAVASAIAKGRIAADDIELNFVGDVSPEFHLAETIGSLKLGSAVRLTPSVHHARSLQYLAESDVLVVIQPGTHLQVPVKLYEYLPFRKPILALAPPGALSTIIEDGGLGLVVAPDDIDAIEDAICHLYEHRHRLAERFHADSTYIARFDGAVVSRQLQGILEAL